eukprot:jgi/Chrzof1/14203/Cz08g29110.t1
MVTGHSNFDTTCHGDAGQSLWNLQKTAQHYLHFVRDQISMCHTGINLSVSGGGASLKDHSRMVVTGDSNFSNNAAVLGGGAYIQDNATIIIADYSLFDRNNACHGAGAYAKGNASITVSNYSCFSNIHADRYGGGVCAMDKATIIIANHSIFSNNNATRYTGNDVGDTDTGNISTPKNSSLYNDDIPCRGGGAYAQDTANISVTNNSTFSNNNAYDGGGVYAQDAVNISVTNNSTFSNNNAYDGGGVYAQDAVNIVVTSHSTFTSNSANRGGGVSATTASIMIGNSTTFSHNSAKLGAGIYAFNSLVTVSNTIFSSNAAQESGGGIYAYYEKSDLPNPGLGITNSNFSNNTAVWTGGAIHGMGPNVWRSPQGWLAITCKNTIIDNNSARSGGGVYLDGATALNLHYSSVTRNTATYQGGGLYVSNLSVLIKSRIPGVIISNNKAGWSGGGVFLVTWSSLPAPQYVMPVIVDNSASFDHDITLPIKNLSWYSNPAQGFVSVPSINQDACDSCLLNQYSLDPHTPCQICPMNAHCFGGAVVIPKEDFWQPTPDDSQSIICSLADIARCPNFEACWVDREHLRVIHPYNFTSLNRTDNWTDYSNSQCKAGYTGRLCSICSYNLSYGQTDPFNCSLCLDRNWKIYLVYIATAMLYLLFIAFTLWVSLPKKSHNQQHDDASAADILKALIMYGQYMVFICKLQINWPVPLDRVFASINNAWSTATGAAVSLDCITGRNSAVFKVWVNLLMPLAMYLLLMMFVVGCGVLQRRSGTTWHQYVKDRWVRALIVTIYFFYPSLVRMALGMFTCKEVCGSRYWVWDMTQKCWDPKHSDQARLAFTVGVFAAAGSLFVPLWVVSLLLCNYKHLDHVQFRRQFDVLYSDYRRDHTKAVVNYVRVTWDAAIHVQTIVLTFVSVYGLLLHEYFQALILTAAFGFYLIAIFYVNPFVNRATRHVQTTLMTCVFATALVSLTFFPPSGFDAAPGDVYSHISIASGCAILSFIMLFVLWALWLLGRAAEWGKLMSCWKRLRRNACFC